MLPETSRLASEPFNYRAINLLSAVGKIADAVILKRLKAVVDARGILPSFSLDFARDPEGLANS
jgi:hypothetical protein